MTFAVLDLFSGIGGFSLGLERAGGFKTVAFCEIEEFPRRVLAKHWPGVPIYHDIRDLTAERLRADGIMPDVLCGGFPCQDISSAGKRAGIDGERSGLWSEYARLIGEIRPRYAIVENVAALLVRGLGRVLGDLAALGYDAEWHCIPASAVGAPHRRDRVWIIAHPNSTERRPLGDACGRLARRFRVPQRQEGPSRSCPIFAPAADPSCPGLAKRHLPGEYGAEVALPASDIGVPTDTSRLLGAAFFRQQSHRTVRSYWPETWPERLGEIRRMDDGISGGVGALAALGNAVVPQIPEIIGRAIIAKEAA